MRDENFPTPVSDPEAEGLPGTADDDSTAYDDVASPREADGQSPAPLPADHPMGVDRFGTTAEEQRLGTPLDERLAQEEPDFDAEDRPRRSGPVEDDEDDEDGRSRVEDDMEGTGPVYDPHSKVSAYDRPDFDDRGGPIGRLVEPDQGSGLDDEKDLIAYDAGAAGGGPSAEELAMHEVRPPPDTDLD
ncbi:MAG TPA: DUF5709 domain-containing protein [Pilimelia sp.]|nr:DUF5709 domain-containing protein [Pilimelia sp.]